ncbi:MAG: adenosine kinase [Ignavibacteriae bacterium HGW-Ignavibacteriae-1]|jgi:hypothetical protein|nr:MAG: adenosine kinase [Ignavibacteriae bacterium HGW-Ignavibacteriae-1]
MKDIQLLGLGNGLVDFQYELSDAEFAKLGLSRGEMRLVEDDVQSEILKSLAGKAMNRCSGGSAANTIIAFSQLGGKAAYKTVVGDDEFGRFYAEEFKKLGIILSAQTIAKTATGTCVVLITPDSERTMHTCLAATALFTEKNIDEELIKRAEWLYIEGYKFSNPSGTKAVFKAMEYAKLHHTKVAVTFSDTFITDNFKANLDRVVNDSELVFCNEAEALSFTGKATLDEAMDFFADRSQNVVITMGAQGSQILWNRKKQQIDAYPANLVDTTGAGDVFAGAFMYGLIDTNSLRIAGRLASSAGAKVVSQLGARVASGLTEIKTSIYNLNK